MGGKLIINGGTISGYYSVEIDAGTVQVNGGAFAEPILIYTDEYSSGTLTFGDSVKDDFTAKMYKWDNTEQEYIETMTETEAEFIEYTQKTVTGDDEEPDDQNP